MKKILMVLSCVLMIGIVYAVFYDEVTFENDIALSDVEIEIVQDKDHISNAVTGVVYDYPIYIQNLGEPCFIRVKEPTKKIVFNTSWTFKEGYYYYEDIVDYDEAIEFCDSLTLLDATSNFMWDVEADAIQSKHVAPDFNSDHPWNDYHKEGDK